MNKIEKRKYLIKEKKSKLTEKIEDTKEDYFLLSSNNDEFKVKNKINIFYFKDRRTNTFITRIRKNRGRRVI